MSSGLYIITHKQVANIYPKDRKIMLVGAKDKESSFGYFTDYDESKDNISEKNKNFCELTGLYYFTKYDNSEILSLEHYRRLFIKTRLFLFKFPFLKEKNIKKILKNHDMIVPKKTRFPVSVFEHYSNAHSKEDMEKVKNIISDIYPDYLNAFNKVMEGNETYLFNMFIAKREVIVGYSKWLFDILFELEKQIDLSNRDSYQQRVFGFISERLLLVYILKNKINVCEKRVQFVECSPFKTQIKRIINKFKRNKEK